MAKTVEELENENVALRSAVSEANKGLIKIINVSPLSFLPTSPGKGIAISKAFDRAQEVADATLLKVSDLVPEE